MKLIRVDRNLTGPNINVLVEDQDGVNRAVNLVWHAQEGSQSTIPDTWMDSVLSEVTEARRKEKRPNDISDIIDA